MTPPPTSSTTYDDAAPTAMAGIAAWTPRLERSSEQRTRAASGVKSTQDRICRAINVVVAFIGLVLAAPLMLVISVLIKATSPGPAIYKQPRVGIDRRQRRGAGASDSRRRADRGGKIFTIYKFRTMRSDQDGSQIWSSKSDPRVTAIGKVLRATRLDEIPQLYNVLLGDMNIVGPRPEQPEIFQDLSERIVNYRERQRVLPGITGLAQVNLGYDSTLEDVRRKVALDLQYIERRSPTEDLLIMAKTMPVMAFQKVWM